MKKPIYVHEPSYGSEQYYVRQEHGQSFFFSRDTMQFFACRVCEGAYEVPGLPDHAFLVITQKKGFDNPAREARIVVAVPVPAKNGGRSGYTFQYLGDPEGYYARFSMKFPNPASARRYIARLQDAGDEGMKNVTWIGKNHK